MHRIRSQSSNRKKYSFTKESGASTKFEPFANRRKLVLKRENTKRQVVHAIQSDVGMRSPRANREPDERAWHGVLQSDPPPSYEQVLREIEAETTGPLPQKAKATPEGLAKKSRWEKRSRDLRGGARMVKSSREDTASTSGAIKLAPEHDELMDRAGAKGIRYAQQKRINRSQRTAAQLALGAYKPVRSSSVASVAATGTALIQTTNGTGTSVIGTTKAIGTSVTGTTALTDTVVSTGAKKPPAQFLAHLKRDLPEESLLDYEQRKEKREGIVYLISQYGPDKKLIDYETPPEIYEKRNPLRPMDTLSRGFDMLAIDAMTALDKPQP